MKNKEFKAEYAQLPHTRPQVFTDRIEMHAGTFLLCGLLLSVFALPLLAVRFYTDLMVSTVQQSFAAQQITQIQLEGTVQTIQLFSSLINILCYGILGVGVMGVIRIVKRLAWSESVSFWQDFAIGVRQNLGGVWCFVAMGLLNAFHTVVLQNDSGLLTFLPWCLYAFVWLPILLHIIVQISIYNHKAWDIITTSAFVYIKTAPVSILFSMLFMSYGLMDLIGSAALKYVLKIGFVVLLPFLMLGWFLYCCSALDRYVNERSYPDLVDKGVWRIK